MIYGDLFFSFFRIGLFAFGGGYAMVPLMQAEIQMHGWLDPAQFADIVAVSQMTPGPIAVNAATYVGFRAAGIAGSISATAGVCLPSLIITVLVAKILRTFMKNPVVASIFTAIRPATVGLIASAVIFFAEMSIFRNPLPFPALGRLLVGQGTIGELSPLAVHWGGVVIFGIVFVFAHLQKLDPITAILISAILGMILM